MIDEIVTSGDPRLTPFLRASSEAEARAVLEALMVESLRRIVDDTLRRELRGSRIAAGHAEDIAGDVHVRLTRKLWSLRAGMGEPINDLSAYAATTAERACYAFFRQQLPQRTRLRNRIRYAAAHHPGLALTRDAAGRLRCGAATPRPVAQGGLQDLLDTPGQWLASHGLGVHMPLPALVAGILMRLDGPVDLERLVDALASAMGIADRRPVTLQPYAPDAIEVADAGPGAEDVISQREALLAVWRQIACLPPRQRAALLLNLRDPEGGAVLQLLPTTSVVTMVDIAAALGMTAERLDRIWNRLPLDDHTIAGLIGATRQQVINLRKSARARLARRTLPAASGNT